MQTQTRPEQDVDGTAAARPPALSMAMRSPDHEQALATATALDRHGYLFGQHITRSLSPYLHQLVYDHLGLPWQQLRLDSADMRRFLDLVRQPACYGASVTMPNKVAVLAHLDDMTSACRDVGACNTVFVKEGPPAEEGGPPTRRLCGANTDVVGIRDAFRHNVPGGDADGIFGGGARPALVIGGGGAARSAVYALRKWMGVGAIYLVNRDDEEVGALVGDCVARGYGQGLVHVASEEDAARVAVPGAVVACVPDKEPRTEGEVRARRVTELLLGRKPPGEKGVVLEMCYNPSPSTRLGALATEKGWRLILGTEAMIWQGLEQDRYWTGVAVEDMPVGRVKDAIGEEVRRRAEEARP